MGSRVVFYISAMMLGLLLTADSNAAEKKCSDLMKDLQAMKKAQHQLFTSFTQKNGTVAEVLDQHADQLQQKMNRQGKLKKSDFQSLKQSAKAFRGHEDREEKLVQRFEKATQELLEQVESCLAEKSDIASLQN